MGTIHRHPADNRIHFSELKMMSLCPAEYAHACQTSREMTQPMMVGAIADCLVFGNRGYELYPGKVRNGKEWEAFKAANPGKMLPIRSELDEARGAAESVLSSAKAMRVLEGCEFQRVVQWESHGLPRAAGILGERGGVDAYHPTAGHAADMKITDTVEPEALRKHAWKMLWHVQAADYLDALRANGVDVSVFKLICVKRRAPHLVTVLNVSELSLERGRRSLAFWSEKVRACEQTGNYPDYGEAEDTLDPPEWSDT